jgi:mono/diheme cytochrome c family protein
MSIRIIAPAIITAALVTAAAMGAPAPQGDPVKGKANVLKYGCYTCHGYQGQGAGATGKKLAPNPLPYPAFSAFVRSTSRDMPPFTEKVMPEQDLMDIHAYFKSIPASPNPANIPLLKDIGG